MKTKRNRKVNKNKKHKRKRNIIIQLIITLIMSASLSVVLYFFLISKPDVPQTHITYNNDIQNDKTIEIEIEDVDIIDFIQVDPTSKIVVEDFLPIYKDLILSPIKEEMSYDGWEVTQKLAKLNSFMAKYFYDIDQKSADIKSVDNLKNMNPDAKFTLERKFLLFIHSLSIALDFMDEYINGNILTTKEDSKNQLLLDIYVSYTIISIIVGNISDSLVRWFITDDQFKVEINKAYHIDENIRTNALKCIKIFSEVSQHLFVKTNVRENLFTDDNENKEIEIFGVNNFEKVKQFLEITFMVVYPFLFTQNETNDIVKIQEYIRIPLLNVRNSSPSLSNSDLIIRVNNIENSCTAVYKTFEIRKGLLNGTWKENNKNCVKEINKFLEDIQIRIVSDGVY